MSPCVLTREWFRLLYISITIMLLSLPNKLIILGTEVEVRGIPLCITFHFCAPTQFIRTLFVTYKSK